MAFDPNRALQTNDPWVAAGAFAVLLFFLNWLLTKVAGLLLGFLPIWVLLLAVAALVTAPLAYTLIRLVLRFMSAVSYGALRDRALIAQAALFTVIWAINGGITALSYFPLLMLAALVLPIAAAGIGILLARNPAQTYLGRSIGG